MNDSDDALLYWKKIDCDVMTHYVPENKYIITTLWPGGMNNVRLSFELSCALAYCTNRTLVVPDTCFIAHCTTLYHALNLFFNFEDLGISVILMTEFCKKENIAMADVNESNKSFVVYNGQNFDSCINFINICNNGANPNPKPKPKCFLKRTEIKWCENSKYLYFNWCLLGSFYSMIYDENAHNANCVKMYVCKHVHYKSEIFEVAAKLVRWLKDVHGEYYSMHMRRGDFVTTPQFSSTCIPICDVMKNIAPHVPLQSCLYISTNSNDLNEINEMKSKYKIITFVDVLNGMNAVSINPAFYGIIEQIICSRGIKFISHPLSTFSTHVNRLRGYMPDVPDKFCYQTNSSERFNALIDQDWSGLLNVWSQEFSDGYTFES